MSGKRKLPIYQNFEVYDSKNNLMFRTNHNRIKWYLKRDLAEIIKEDPIAIRLKFKPKGKGERIPALKVPLINQCVCCGNTDLSLLTKHHIVPQQYKKCFPKTYKEHSSLLVTVLCIKCHNHYEKQFAAPLNAFLNKLIAKRKNSYLEKLITFFRLMFNIKKKSNGYKIVKIFNNKYNVFEKLWIDSFVNNMPLTFMNPEIKKELLKKT